jgi:hypothetical protein
MYGELRDELRVTFLCGRVTLGSPAAHAPFGGEIIR